MAESARRLLIIDDDRDFASSLCDLLELEGYRVSAITSTGNAREALREFDPQVCLVDIRLGMDSGLELIPRLHREKADLLCVMMTAYADTGSAVQSLQVGAYDYLRKPLKVEELQATLERCFTAVRLNRENSAAQAAVARRNKQLRALNRRLELVVSAAEQLASCLDLQALNREVLHSFSAAMTAEGGSLFLAEDSRLVLAETLDPTHVPSELRLPAPKDTILGHCIATGKPLLIRDIGKETRLQTSGWGGYKGRSLLVIPLWRAEGELLGLITLHNKKRSRFTPQDLHIGRILGSYAVEVYRTLRAVEALRKSEAKYRHLFESSPALNLVIDIEGVVRDANEHLGFARDQVVGRPLLELVRPEQRETVSRSLQAVFSMEVIPDLELPLVDSSGAIRTFLLPGGRSSLLYESGVLSGIQLSAVDITERKRAQATVYDQERQLLQASKLASLGTLVSGIAHEINNPNNFIRLNVQNLQEFWEEIDRLLRQDRETAETVELGGLSYHQAREVIEGLLRGIHDGSRRIEKLVQSLKIYARREDSRLEEAVDINRVVDSSLTILQNMVRSSTDNLTCQLDAELPPVLGRHNELEQVVINLISNACQSLESADKAIAISTGFDRDTNRIEVKVADEGRGISSRNLLQITDPFFTTRRDQGGTGLGLSVAVRIAEGHGGELRFDSALGKGTVVTFSLPAA